jgi:hypothetical protein
MEGEINLDVSDWYRRLDYNYLKFFFCIRFVFRVSGWMSK